MTYRLIAAGGDPSIAGRAICRLIGLFEYVSDPRMVVS
jgi:hypothetical protein